MTEGDVDGLSIGFRVPEKGFEVDPKKRERRLKEIELVEVSVVALPANEQARVQAAKSAITWGEIPSRGELERLLHHDLGLPHRKAKRFLESGYAGLAPEMAELDELLAGIKRLTKAMRNG